MQTSAGHCRPSSPPPVMSLREETVCLEVLGMGGFWAAVAVGCPWPSFLLPAACCLLPAACCLKQTGECSRKGSHARFVLGRSERTGLLYAFAPDCMHVCHPLFCHRPWPRRDLPLLHPSCNEIPNERVLGPLDIHSVLCRTSRPSSSLLAAAMTGRPRLHLHAESCHDMQHARPSA